MNYDPLHHPFPSRRNTVYARNGMVATSQPLAAQAGLRILQQGGNAIDAAIATAACLTVVEPTSNGIGGDAFALVWVKDQLHGLNASGPAPKRISIEAVKAAGFDQMPRFGFVPVTVPGAPSAWVALSERFGKLSLQEVLQPAIDYAEHGYPISPTLGKYWNSAYNVYKANLHGDAYTSWFDTFAPHGRAPAIGEIWRSQGHAETLSAIARTKGQSFYHGELAVKIHEYSAAHGGFITADDLATYEPEWVQPIHTSYRGYDVWEIPPNGQGLVALLALAMLDHFPESSCSPEERMHRQIEAIKLAFAEGLETITDPRAMRVAVDELLSSENARAQFARIGETAIDPAPTQPGKGGTVYLATADGEGNMVSFIQSNYMGFGSGLVVPGTGIGLQNRGHTFSLDPSHVNALAPGKRTYHTIIPGFLTKDGKPVGPFGVMGGFMQPQGHVQVIMNTIDLHLNPQASLDAPRWQWMHGKKVEVERGVPEHVVQSLVRRGHDISIAVDGGGFGRGQIIWRDEHGVLAGGTEPRTDGAVAAW